MEEEKFSAAVRWRLGAGVVDAGGKIWPLRRLRRTAALDLRFSKHGLGARPMWHDGFQSVLRGGMLLRLTKPDGDVLRCFHGCGCPLFLPAGGALASVVVGGGRCVGLYQDTFLSRCF